MRPTNNTDRRRNQIRTFLLIAILFALPFYPVGIWLWASAPDPDAPNTEETLVQTETQPPLGADDTEIPDTNTPRPSRTPSDPLDPTPIGVFTGGGGNPTAIQPTLFIPTSTSAPSLTSQPTATWTLIPSFTPFPSNTPLSPPSDTPIPPPSNTPIPPPSNTPLPPPSNTPIPPPTNTPVSESGA